LNSDFNFWIGSGTAIIVLFILLTTRVDVTDVELETSESVKVKDIFELFRLKNFWIFVIFIIGISTMYTIYDQQFPRYFAQQFVTVAMGNQMYGYINSLQTFLEAGMMFVAPKIVNKFGTRNSMLLVGVSLATRVLLTSLAAGPIMITLIKLIQSFDMPLMYIAIFKYINLNFEARLSSILYLIGYQFISQIGVIGLSTSIGKMYDSLGYRMAYMYLGLLISTFVVISFFTLNKDSQTSNAD
jgi:LacY proton/sugar symporter.